jgi:hypothetical protein
MYVSEIGQWHYSKKIGTSIRISCHQTEHFKNKVITKGLGKIVDIEYSFYIFQKKIHSFKHDEKYTVYCLQQPHENHLHTNNSTQTESELRTNKHAKKRCHKDK